jgi:hypothetical protein
MADKVVLYCQQSNLNHLSSLYGGQEIQKKFEVGKNGKNF